MKHFLSKATRGMALVVILAFGLFLVAAAILRGAGWVLSDIFGESGSIAELLLPHNRDEVQNYVLFTYVKYGNRQVITGTEYTSTFDQSIKSQWCYLAGGGYSAAQTNLSLARISKDGTKTISPFINSTLSQFGLTTTSAKALVKSH